MKVQTLHGEKLHEFAVKKEQKLKEKYISYIQILCSKNEVASDFSKSRILKFKAQQFNFWKKQYFLS
jgi:hypothetical protein